MRLVLLLARVVNVVFVTIGALATAAIVGILVLMPNGLPEPTRPVDYPVGAYPIAGDRPVFPPDLGEPPPYKDADAPFRLLALSQGGEGGAYGAGVLAASSATNTWPEFDIYTGVSVGALLATMAFVDRADHTTLKPIVEEIAAAVERDVNRAVIWDIIGIALGRGIPVAYEIQRIVKAHIDRGLVEQIAAKHAEGRRLYVVSADLTGGTPVLWDLGAIASAAGRDPVEPVQNALIASLSVPLIFPPQVIIANGDQTLQVDGGIMRPFYVSDHFIELSRQRPFEIHFLANIKLDTPPQVETLAPRFDSILHRLIYLILRANTDNALERLLLDKILFNWTVKVASVPPDLPGMHATDAMTGAAIIRAFDVAYAATRDALGEQEALSAVWAPLSADMIGRPVLDEPIRSRQSQELDNDTTSAP